MEPVPEPDFGQSYHRQNTSLALFLALGPGLVAIYGLGHIYLHKFRRGLVFLVSATIPFGLVGLSMVYPQIPWFLSTIAWFTILLIQTYDLTRISKTVR